MNELVTEVPLIAGLKSVLHISYETYRRKRIAGQLPHLRVRRAGRQYWVTVESLEQQREADYRGNNG